jgi:hypothetical protein
MEDFVEVVQRLQAWGVAGKIWLDGSFVTRKVNPLDIDFVLFANADQYDGSPSLQSVIDALVEPAGGWPPPSCDTNVWYFGEDTRRYWEQKLGTHPTKGLPKGIVVVTLGE